jgi:glycerate 2-kinase
VSERLTAAAVAREILLAAIRAVDPRELTQAALGASAAGLAPKSVELIAIGKAAVAMAHGAHDAIGGALRGGVVIAPDAVAVVPVGISAFAGGHPWPNEGGAHGAQAVMELLRGLTAGSHAIVLISGGASALSTLPVDGVSLDDMIATSRTLMEAGADIAELNCVRKHLDQLKGGLMARLSNGAEIRALVLSDVIGDPLDVIGSGPLVPDPTTYGDAIAVLERRGVWERAPRAVTAHLLAGARGERIETPKEGDRCFGNITIEVIGNNLLAVQGAAGEAMRRNISGEMITTPIAGEARDHGAAFARHIVGVAASVDRSQPRCVVGGGETTVTVTGNGIGGRNLEFAAAAALVIDGARGITIGSIGTDGRDGPTDAAGAIVDGGTAQRARDAGMDLVDHLRASDTLRALDVAGAVVRTGPTGTNVADVYVALITP